MCEHRWCRFCCDTEKLGPHVGKISPEIIRRFNRKFNPMVEDENGQKIRKPYRCPRSGSRYTLADRFCDERKGQWKCSVNDNPMPYRYTNAEIRERVAHRNQPAQPDSTEAGNRTIRRSKFRRCKFSLPPHERPREEWVVRYPSESGKVSIWFDNPLDALKHIKTNGGEIQRPK